MPRRGRPCSADSRVANASARDGTGTAARAVRGAGSAGTGAATGGSARRAPGRCARQAQPAERAAAATGTELLAGSSSIGRGSIGAGLRRVTREVRIPVGDALRE